MKNENNSNKKRRITIYIIAIVIIVLALITSCSCTSNFIGTVGSLIKNIGGFLFDDESNITTEVVRNKDLKFDTDEVKMSLSDGEIKISFSYEYINPKDLTCKTTNANIATCYVTDGMVNVIPKSKGTITVYLSSKTNGKTYEATTKVIIGESNKHINLNRKSITLTKGNEETLTYILEGIGGEIKVTSGDESIATATAKDNILTIRAINIGEVTLTITVTNKGVTYTEEVSVKVTNNSNTPNNLGNQTNPDKPQGQPSNPENPITHQYKIELTKDSNCYIEDGNCKVYYKLYEDEKEITNYSINDIDFNISDFNGNVILNNGVIEIKPNDENVLNIKVTLTYKEKTNSIVVNYLKHEYEIELISDSTCYLENGDCKVYYKLYIDNEEITDYSLNDIDYELFNFVGNDKLYKGYLELNPSNSMLNEIANINLTYKGKTINTSISFINHGYRINLTSNSCYVEDGNCSITYKVYRDNEEIIDYDINEISKTISSNFIGEVELTKGHIMLTPSSLMIAGNVNITVSYKNESSISIVNFKTHDYKIEIASNDCYIEDGSCSITYKVYRDNKEITDYDINEISKTISSNFIGEVELTKGQIVLTPSNSMTAGNATINLTYRGKTNMIAINFITHEYKIEIADAETCKIEESPCIVSYKVYKDNIEVTDYNLSEITYELSSNYQGSKELIAGYLKLVPDNSMIDKTISVSIRYKGKIDDLSIKFITYEYEMSTYKNSYELTLSTENNYKNIVLNTNLFIGDIISNSENKTLTLTDSSESSKKITVSTNSDIIDGITYTAGESNSISFKITANSSGVAIIHVKMEAYGSALDEFDITLNVTKKYKITLDAGEGKFNDFEKVFTYLISEGETLDLTTIENPILADGSDICTYYTFDGYTYEDGTDFIGTNITGLTSDLTLIAKYNLNDSHTLTTLEKKLYLTDVELFYNEEREESIIYPGAKGKYTMHFDNNTTESITIKSLSLSEDTICFEEGCINMGYIVKDASNDYLYGKYNFMEEYYILNKHNTSTKDWVNNKNEVTINLNDEEKTNNTIAPGEWSEITLFWMWVDTDSALDTKIGSYVTDLSVNDKYSLTVGITYEIANKTCEG